ncbi:MAG: hypothetical protein EBV03_04255 [Proteobacteria bacterium]|nr:hypothetical protein [Pseudomonadota bacterium]
MHHTLYYLLGFCLIGFSIRPLGLYMARVYTGEPVWLEKPLGGIERGIYRLCGINPRQEMPWQRYLGSVLLLGVLSVALLLGIFMGQGALPLNPQGFPGLSLDMAFNAAASFTTNTNWQSYSGESALSYFSQMFGCTVQNFFSGATGMAVAVALFRGLARKQAHFIGNAYADVLRSMLYILLPLSLGFSLLLASQGVIQNFSAYVAYTPLDGGSELHLPQGPVASQEAIKMLGSNGGGFFNANSAHPYENPTPLTNLLQMVAMLLVPVAFTYTFGVMVGDRRQGWMLLSAMTVLFLPLATMAIAQERGVNSVISRDLVDVAACFQQAEEIDELRVGLNWAGIWAGVFGSLITLGVLRRGRLPVGVL